MQQQACEFELNNSVYDDAVINAVVLADIARGLLTATYMVGWDIARYGVQEMMGSEPGWGCEACLGYNPPSTARCKTCGVLDSRQEEAIRQREEATREEERRLVAEREQKARQALARLKVGEEVRLCSAIAAQDGFEDLARRIGADEQAAVERASREAAELAARAEDEAAAAAAAAAADEAQSLAAERGEGYDEALSELEAMLGSASVDAAARRAPSPEPRPEPQPEPEPEPEPEPDSALRRHPERLWNMHKRTHCRQRAVVIATEMADITVLLRFDDGWELCACYNRDVFAVLPPYPPVSLIDRGRRCNHCDRRSAGYPVECVRHWSSGTSEASYDGIGGEQSANEEELVILPEARNAMEKIVVHLELIEEEIAAERAEMEAKRLAAEAEAWCINPGRCATVLQARWRGYSVRLNQHRAEVRAAAEAHDAARNAEHSTLGNLLGFLERSTFDSEVVLSRAPHEDGLQHKTEQQRKTEQELQLQKFATRWSTRRNVVRTCFYALVGEMQLSRKIARYDWAATFVQSRYRGFRLRKEFRRKGGFSRRRPKRDKDLSADMLLLRAATAGDMTTSQLVAREKLGGGSSRSVSAAKVKSRFRMDPTAFRKQGLGGTGGVDLAAEAEAWRLARVQELSKRCLHRLSGEAVAYCFDLWVECKNQAIKRAEREVEAPAMEAYEKATTEMERGEWEAAGSYFSLALKAGHPDIWECHFLRGIACSRYGAAEIAVNEFGLAIEASEHRSAAWFNRGVAQLRLGLLEEAFGDLKMTLKLEPGHRKAKETLQLVKEELAMESKANKLPNLKRDGKTAYNVKVMGKYRVRPVSSQTLAAFEEAAQLNKEKGGAKAQRLLAAAGLGRSGSFVTTISAAHHVQPQPGQGGGRKIDRPDFSWPDFHTNPLGEISQNFPVDPFNTTGDGLQDADGDGDIDDEDEHMFELLGEFSAEEVEWLDQAVMLKKDGDWEGIAAWINAAALAKKKQREQDRHTSLGTGAAVPPLVSEDRQQKRQDTGTAEVRQRAGRPSASSSVAVTISPDGKSEKQGAAAAALKEVVGRTAQECKAEWERRIDRYTADGTWVGHGLDRRALTGRTTAEEAVIAKREMYKRLKTLECSHMTTMQQCNPRQIYPRTDGAWFCDECGLPNPVGRMFHCMACNDFDLCSSCMRTSNANAAASNRNCGPNRWARIQADETLVGRVLDSGSTNAKGANRGGLNLFTGERKRTAFASYHNPYSGAQVVHGVLRYPNTVREIPGLDDALRAKERQKIAALGRVLRRRGSAQYQPPGLA